MGRASLLRRVIGAVLDLVGEYTCRRKGHKWFPEDNPAFCWRCGEYPEVDPDADYLEEIL